MPKSNTLISALLAAALIAASTWAAAQQSIALPDFNGLWRLNDAGSDSPEQVTAMLRAELRHEQSPSVAPAGASSSGSPSQQGNHSGHAGGRGGMGGGHMGGGGHGHGGGKADVSTTSADSFSDSDMLKLPPTLASDSVLIVQQDDDALQARLENGEQLAVPVNGRGRHTLDGNAIAHRLEAGQDLRFSLQFNDGSRLDETWSRSADGHALQVTEQWQPGFLQHPVMFHRNYVRIDQ